MPGYGDSAANPPEVNYWTLMTGDHAASAAAAAAGHQALADILATEMAQLTSNATMTATVGWHGVGGTAMTLSAAQLAEIMALAVAWLQQGSLQAAELVQAYHTASQGMIPGPVCTTNRTTQAGLVSTNFFGVNQPAITSLDIAYGEHWTQNATVMAAYQAVVTAVLAALAIPPPFAPPTANPATAALSSAAEIGASAGANSLQSGFQGMSETANAASPAAQTTAGAATDGMSSMMGMPMQMAGQFGQMFGQAPQMLGQAPQMLSQAIQMPMGMLGQLGSATGLGGADAAAKDAAVQEGEVSPGMAAAGISGAGGGGGGGIGAGGAGVMPTSSYTRPVSSFATPSSPKLPAGFTGGAPAAEFTAGTSHATGGTGGGGLYGAPAAMANRDGAGGGAEQRPNRTMQLTARPGIDRGDR